MSQHLCDAGDGILPASGDPTEAAWLSDLVNGCVSMLITVHQVRHIHMLSRHSH